MKKTFKTLIVLLTLIITSYGGHAQLHQTIRGQVFDGDSENPLPGANIVVLTVTPLKGTASDINGRYTIKEVPLGRHTVQVTFVGYEPKTIPNLELTSGKELILNVSLKESIMMDEIVIEATQDKDKSVNKMATISARTFSVDETARYAGSLNDVARMAQNFAGVQGADDSRNDIVIRGNSPTGVLFRFEDVDIPNPNHFALNGTTGGPVSIINNNLLDNSDFMTGAFPAEYGNALAGVFDLHLRNGNNQQHEFLTQIGFNGLEVTTEGPISKEKFSSYLISYRYSTLKLFQLAGLDFGTGSATPAYQDMAFKLNFPNKKGKTVIWGIGGLSEIAFKDSEQEGDNLFTEKGEDIVFESKIGATAISNTYRFSDNSFLKTSMAVDATYNRILNDTLNTANGIYSPLYRNTSTEGKQSFNFTYNNKISAQHLLKIGAYNQRRFFILGDSVNNPTDSLYHPVDSSLLVIPAFWRILTSYKGTTYFFQPYIQWQYRINENITVNSGIHAQYFLYNKSFTIEPRAGIKFNINKKNSISLAYGMHNQLPSNRLFFKQISDEYGQVIKDASGKPVIPNKNLEPIRSQHFVAGYDFSYGISSRIKLETYYQKLDNVPVDHNINHYSILNYGANFDLAFPDTLANKGTGYNYGVELTLEKFLDKGFYYLFTASIYQSKYTGSDGIVRNTAFNGNYTFNALTGKEFFFNTKNPDGNIKSSLIIDVKFTLNGGQRYAPIDLQKSQLIGKAVYDYSRAFESRYDDYMRADFKIGYKRNAKKVTQEWSINLQNMTNRKNIFYTTYDEESNSIVEKYQTGLLPIGQYKITF